MTKIIIQHKNQLDADITDGFVIYDSIIVQTDNITEFYYKGFLVARLRGFYSPHEIALEDTTDDKTTKALIDA